MIENKKIVLTGANSGIGLETLKLLQGKNNIIIAVDLNVDKIETFGKDTIAYQCDLSSKEANDNMFKFALEKLGKIDIFIANAGFPYFEKVDYVDWDRSRNIFDVNTIAPIYEYQKYINSLNGAEGQFVITISAIGKIAMPGFALYSASKFAVQGFQEALRFEISENVSLTCLYPISTKTGFFLKAVEGKNGEMKCPFPAQEASYVAKCLLKGIEKKKKVINPSKLFSVGSVLFTCIPFVKRIYLGLENRKFQKFLLLQKENK